MEKALSVYQGNTYIDESILVLDILSFPYVLSVSSYPFRRLQYGGIVIMEKVIDNNIYSYVYKREDKPQ